MREGRRHLAHGDEPRRLLQLGLALQLQRAQMLMNGDVGGDRHAHDAPIDPARELLVHMVPAPGLGMLHFAVEQLAG